MTAPAAAGTSASASLPAKTDVVIAGGGPSGLFLAADLAARGISSVVLEPRVELDWLHPRAKTTNARTMTHLRRLGLADELRAHAPLSSAYSDCVMFCTSLVGHELTRFSNAFQVHQGRYELQPEGGQQVAQPVVEQVLREAVDRSEAAQLVLGASFLSATDHGAFVDVRVADAAGVEQTVRGRFLVGADGVASTVRRGLGVRLEGSSAAKSNLGVLFRSEQLADLVKLDAAVQYWVVGNTYAGMVGAMDLDGLWWAIVQGYQPDALQFASVPAADVIRSLVGAEIDVEVLAEDPWTARMLLSPTYRVGNVFLVGDAAHANPPWGGHGFNTCIGDAANLAWKLDAALAGWAGPELLDSYQAERRPIARRTIDEAEANGTVLASDVMNPDLDAEGSAGARAREAAARALQVKESEFHSLGLVLGYDYADSAAVSGGDAVPPAPDPIHYRPSTVPGCLLPHTWLADGTSLYDLLGAGFTVLVNGDEQLAADVAAAVPARVGAVPITVRAVQLPTEAAAIWASSLLLVRPDQHIAWRGDDIAALTAALLRAAGHAESASHPEPYDHATPEEVLR